MNKQEAFIFVNGLKRIFDIVRLVNVAEAVQYEFSEEGELIAKPYQCYAVWNKNRRCENCISAKAFARKSRMSKFEFVGGEVYHVISLYIELDGQPYMLEMVSKTDDETLFGAYGKDDFSKTITSYTKKLYTDPLTGAYNRAYYEEQLSALNGGITAAAIFDCDYFKTINDNFGHDAGDMALKTVAETVSGLIRSSDALIRFGGDEFIVVFNHIPADAFEAKLELIREKVSQAVVEGYPDICLSISVGGVYSESHIKDFLKEADEMLYKAKKRRNCVCVEYI